MRTSRLFVAILCCTSVWLAFTPKAASYKYTTAGGSCPNGVTWPASSIPVSYYVNQDTASSLSYSPVQSAIDSAFDRWGKVCCASFSANYQGKTSETVTPSSGPQNGSSKHIMDWEENNWPQQLPGNAAAVT
ncbi:MAG: hypothetical protein ABEK29_11350, partial [Bradymonadaceae bacterium]